ncbi:MAG: endonuclease Q family protein [Nibricoccus sp.]
MKLAVDLHLHSRYAGHVSPDMTLPRIITCAQCKGLDVLGTGDCLQSDWLREIEGHLFETGSGFLLPRAETYQTSRETLPLHLQRPVRFVLSTEVCCAPHGTKRLGGLHHLLYFRSLASVRRLREKLLRFGDLKDGRPTLALSSHDLLALILDHGDGCELAPAHVLSPWFSSLGSVSGRQTLQEIFGDNARHLLAIETGITSTPAMCRRISALDGHTLICSSDAHSPAKLGREYTILDIEPNYDSVISTLRHPAQTRLLRYVKYPCERTGYYYNYCGFCQNAQHGSICAHCERPLIVGSRDRVEVIADRNEPISLPHDPPFCELVPLVELIAQELGLSRDSERVCRLHTRFLHEIGHERYVITEAPLEELLHVTTPAFANAIVDQRHAPHALQSREQLSLRF